MHIFSDHIPITYDTVHVKVAGSSGATGLNKTSQKFMRWDKADTTLFYDITGQLLQNVRLQELLVSIGVPVGSVINSVA